LDFQKNSIRTKVFLCGEILQVGEFFSENEKREKGIFHHFPNFLKII
jgi:hypothetical protein